MASAAFTQTCESVLGHYNSIQLTRPLMRRHILFIDNVSSITVVIAFLLLESSKKTGDQLRDTQARIILKSFKIRNNEMKSFVI